MFFAFLRTLCPTPVRSPDQFAVTGFPAWRVRRCKDLRDFEALWPLPEREDNFWIRRDVLGFLSEVNQGCPTEGVVVTNTEDGRKLLFTLQDLYFNAAGQVSNAAKGATSRWDLRRRLLGAFSFKVLSMGQLLVSGDYGQDGTDLLDWREKSELLPAILETIAGSDRSYAATMFKDCFPAGSPTHLALARKGYTTLPVDPVMQLRIRSGWNSVDDYLADLTSKYRVRYRRARTKLGRITSRRLLPEEVRGNIDRIYGLYRTTSAGADINLTDLRKTYFQWLAGVAEYTGYFNEAGEMIAFTTYIADGPVAHAHYLGIEEAYKFSHHLYHNMLFDLLESAIREGFSVLDYGRTALEIKSSVGAEAVEFASLLRARSGLINRLIPYFMPAVFTAKSWEPRNPYAGK